MQYPVELSLQLSTCCSPISTVRVSDVVEARSSNTAFMSLHRRSLNFLLP